MYKFIENIKLAIKSIWGKKIRSFLTMLGVIIGVFAIVLLIGIGEGVKDEVTGQFEGLGSNIIMVMPGAGFGGGPISGGGSFSEEDFDVVKGVEGIEYTIPMAIVPLPVLTTPPVAPSDTENYIVPTNEESAAEASIFAQAAMQVIVFGSTSDVEKAFAGSDLAAGESYGRMFNESEYDNAAQVATLQSGAVTQLFPDKSAEEVIGETIYIGKVEFEVIGAQEPVENESLLQDPTMTNMAIIPLTAVETLTDSTNISQFAVTVDDPEKVEEVQENIRLALLESHEGVEDFSITNSEELLDMFDQILGVLTSMLGGIAAISLLVGGIGVMNIMLVSVTERTKEIGLRKAIGASGLDILIQFLVEAIFLTFLGGAIGILLAYIGSVIMDKQFGFAPSITIQSVLMAFAFTAVIGMIFGVAPAVRAARLNPIDALKYE
ncbi:MAG: ABC transporter permease [bacterium]|nr:ABC transporter permease [bacterium]